MPDTTNDQNQPFKGEGAYSASRISTGENSRFAGDLLSPEEASPDISAPSDAPRPWSTEVEDALQNHDASFADVALLHAVAQAGSVAQAAVLADRPVSDFRKEVRAAQRRVAAMHAAVSHALDVEASELERDSVPSGLVAGNAVVLDGLYTGSLTAQRASERVGDAHGQAAVMVEEVELDLEDLAGAQ